jgi:hypothetical protein
MKIYLSTNQEEEFSMSTSLLLNIEDKLIADEDGAYRAELIQLLEKYRDDFAFAKQGFLPQDEYELADQMELAINIAVETIKRYKKEDDITHQPDTDADTGPPYATMIAV